MKRKKGHSKFIAHDSTYGIGELDSIHPCQIDSWLPGGKKQHYSRTDVDWSLGFLQRLISTFDKETSTSAEAINNQANKITHIFAFRSIRIDR